MPVTVRPFFDALLWRLLPGVCLLCNQRSGVAMDLCPYCRSALPWVGHACRSCALPLTESEATLCGRCRAHPPPFARAVAALRYVDPVAGMVQRLKFNGSRIDARVLGQLLADCINDVYRADPLPQLIVPVPLGRARLLRRGHNQAALLARWVGTALAVPVDYDACRRVRNTPPQMGLSRSARLRNLASAFEAERRVADLKVALLDDVMTTGGTAAALARVLSAAGATEVHVWSAARTLEPHMAQQALE